MDTYTSLPDFGRLFYYNQAITTGGSSNNRVSNMKKQSNAKAQARRRMAFAKKQK